MIVELAASMVTPGSWPNKQQGQQNQPNNLEIAELIARSLARKLVISYAYDMMLPPNFPFRTKKSEYYMWEAP